MSNEKTMDMELEIEIAMDLGTANTRIFHNDKMVVDEPSVVALERNSNRMIALGGKARSIQGKVHSNIKFIPPLREGVVAQYADSELLVHGLIKKAVPELSQSSIKMVVSIPSGCTEVEIQALRHVCEKSGVQKVFMLYGPQAAAIGIGIDVENPKGCMIVDIGGGITDIAVISLGGIVASKTIKMGGDSFTNDVIKHMKRRHGIVVSEHTAEFVKNDLGIVRSDVGQSEDYTVHGIDYNSSRKEVTVTPEEIALCVEKTVSHIEDVIIEVLEEISPELYQDLIESGIWLTGGGSLLRGLDKRFSDKFGIEFHVVDEPLYTVVHGTSLALKNLDKYAFLMK